jgi:hypothetical protein
MTSSHPPSPEPATPPARPWLAEQASRFMILEWEVEREFRPRLLAALQGRVDAVAEQTHSSIPSCPRCRCVMSPHDGQTVSWLACFGRLHARVWRLSLPDLPWRVPARMRHDEYLRLGYGIGSGAVESAHKQVVLARLRQAQMRWSEAGARRLLALRLLAIERQPGLVGEIAHGFAGLTWPPNVLHR